MALCNQMIDIPTLDGDAVCVNKSCITAIFEVKPENKPAYWRVVWQPNFKRDISKETAIALKRYLGVSPLKVGVSEDDQYML